MRKSGLVNLGHPEVTVELPWVRVGEGRGGAGRAGCRYGALQVSWEGGGHGEDGRPVSPHLDNWETSLHVATSLKEQWRTWTESGHVKALSFHIQICVRKTESAASWPEHCLPCPVRRRGGEEK